MPAPRSGHAAPRGPGWRSPSGSLALLAAPRRRPRPSRRHRRHQLHARRARLRRRAAPAASAGLSGAHRGRRRSSPARRTRSAACPGWCRRRGPRVPVETAALSLLAMLAGALLIVGAAAAGAGRQRRRRDGARRRRPGDRLPARARHRQPAAERRAGPGRGARRPGAAGDGVRAAARLARRATCRRAELAATGRLVVLAAFAAGLAIGLRTQTAWLTLPLLVLVIADRAGRGAAAAIVGSAVTFTAGVLAWAMPLVDRRPAGPAPTGGRSRRRPARTSKASTCCSPARARCGGWR